MALSCAALARPPSQAATASPRALDVHQVDEDEDAPQGRREEGRTELKTVDAGANERPTERSCAAALCDAASAAHRDRTDALRTPT